MTPDSVALFIDYGFSRSEYYHPQRVSGTLMAHRRHRATPDVLADIGLADITAHVDFTGVAEAATAAGGQVLGYTSQAAFLVDCGIADLLEGSAAEPRTWLPQASALNLLLSPAEMGELFKAIAIGKRPWDGLPGFRGGDRSRSLDPFVP
jgi:SAM-dependent MidA family methyltransferase